MELHTATDGLSPFDAQDIALCKQIVGILDWHYPGHPWAVNADHKTGIADIRLFYTDKQNGASRYGFLFKIGDMSGANIREKVMRGGGELLERYGLPRGKAAEDSEFRFREHGLDKSN